MRQIYDSSYSNRDLIAGVRAGDAECATEFYRRYGKRIDRLIRSLLGADTAHEDVVQMVFLNVLSSLSSVRDASRLDYWVDSVTFRTVYKEIRSRKYRRQVVAASDSLPEVADFRTPDKNMVTKHFYQALNELKAEERMVLIMKYFEHSTLLEMADISGWSVATVKRRVNRAVAAFEKIASEDAVLASYVGEKHNVG
ncbi:MAG: sigma-70 family RNA polymerase sigma factor [Deltaproteobacteria bacterium]|nr:sigma-70 family RNA polymerase sigma factor [Deltaproteobacteria bacterium]MBN2672475.1 sigma-70 family RNA polymerase sigma factor [Deltaproteobacteria bacterium]